MRFSLRTRLLASYLLLMTLTLGIIGAALFILTSRQPEPPNQTYQELLAVARNLDRQQLMPSMRPGVFRDNDNEALQEFAETYNVRILLLHIEPNFTTVSFDTSGMYPQSNRVLTMKIDQDYSLRYDRLLEWVPNSGSPLFGSFTDLDNVNWLFVGIKRELSGNAIIMADLRPDRSLQRALIEFGADLGIPLLQAASVGLFVAVLLAAFISHTIANPLKKVGIAAQAVAQGDYDHLLPLEGPSEVQAVSEAFNHMMQEVRSTHQSQRDFLANVSHDLKTPLTSIQGYSQAIMDGAAKDPSRAAAIICDEAGRLTRMVTELTDLARLQAGAIHMHMSAIDAGQIVQSITQRLTVVAQKRGIEMSTDIQPTVPIAGDGDRLAQVFTNLISNAINYTPEGGRIYVSVQPGRGGVEISVRDTGIGIPQQELSRIFERFYQVDKTRGPRRGTGLGLAITREIVQGHGGEVFVSSPGEGLGSTFTVWLPMGRLADSVHERQLAGVS